MPERMSTARRVAYSFGNAGFLLTDRIIVTVVVYFYLPPAGRGLEPQVPERVFLGFLTVFGVAMLVGRLFDSLADPVVGNASDRARSRLGRRRSFMLGGIVPMVGIPVLIFFPPGGPESLTNAWWLGGLLALYFVFFTVYVAPYLALIPELAWTQTERVRLVTLLAIVSGPIMFGFGILWPLGLDLGRELGLDAADAVRVVVVAASLFALALCAAPIVAVDEARFARGNASDLPLGEALAATLRNRPFVVYLGAQLLFIFGINLIQPIYPYLATSVLGRSEGFAASLGAAMGAGIVLGFLGMDAFVRRFGPKRVMVGCVALFALAIVSLGLLRADVPGGPHDARNLAIAFTASLVLGAPVAGFMVVPHVLISQLIDYDERRTGAARAAMYFGVQGFLTKWIYGASLWVFTYLLSRFGSSPDEPLGVLLVGPVAGAACLVSAALYVLYPERQVLLAAREDGA